MQEKRRFLIAKGVQEVLDSFVAHAHWQMKSVRLRWSDLIAQTTKSHRLFLVLLCPLLLTVTGCEKDECDQAQMDVNVFLGQFQNISIMSTGGGPVNTNISAVYEGKDCWAMVTVEVELNFAKGADWQVVSGSFEGVGSTIWADYPAPGDDCSVRKSKTVRSSGQVRFGNCGTLGLFLSVYGQCCDGTDVHLAIGTIKRITAIVDCTTVNQDEGCTSCGPSSSSGPAVQMFNNAGPSTTLAFGKSDSRRTEKQQVGQFTMMYDQTDTNLFSPRMLTYFPRSTDVEIIYTTNSPTYIRQVKAVDGLADVVVISTNQYEVRTYHPTNVLSTNASGLWQVTNSPMRSVCFQNPNAGTTNTCDLLVVVNESGTSLTNHYCWVPTNSAWTLTRPNGLSQHSTSSVLTNSGNYRTDTHQICDTNTGVVSLTAVCNYTNFAWGAAMIEGRLNPASSDRSVNYEYYTSTNDFGYSQLKKVTYPGAGWAYYTYDSAGRPKELLSSFKNQAYTTDTNLCRYTWYDYALLSGSGDAGADTNKVRTKVQCVLGKEVSRSYFVYLADGKKEIQCTTTNAAWDNSSNLVTTTRYYTNGSFNGWLKSVLYPEGTYTVYEYGTNATSRTNIVWHGQPGANYTNVIDGTKTVAVKGTAGQALSTLVYDITSAILTAQETYTNFDGWNRPGRVTHLDTTSEDMVYGCCGLDSLTDREGVTTAFTYDDLRRKTIETRNSISKLFTYNANNRLTRTQRQGTNGTTITLSQSAYDQAGRIQYQTNVLGGVTSYTYGTNGSGQLTTTVTNADGGTRIELYYADGRLAKVTGSAVHPVRYDYDVESDGGVYRAYIKEIKLDADGNDTSEWVKTYTDLVDRNYKTLYAAASGTPNNQSFFNIQGQLWKTVNPDSVTNLFAYSARGEQEYTSVDLDNNGQINLSGIDRVTRTISDVATNSALSANVRRTRTFVWSANNVDASNLVSTAEASVDGLKSWSTVWNNGVGVTNKTQTVYAGGGNRYVTNTAPDGSHTISAFSNGRLTSVTRKDSGDNQILKTTYGYDAHGRQSSVADARNGTTTYTFNDADQIVTFTTPTPGTGQPAQTTTMYYDNLARSSGQLLPDNTTTTNLYYVTGLLKRTSGSRSYPVGYSYDAQGRMKTMTNWSSFADNTGVRVTTWNYDSYRGFPSSKTYDGGAAGPSYTYTGAGRPLTRLWARGTNTTYFYNNAGDLSATTYNDGVTPGSTNTYDRRGRQVTALCNGMTTTLTYNDASQLVVETNSGGTLDGLAVTNAYDTLLRRAAVALNTQSATLTQFGYDNASRLASVTNGINTATYSYLANSPLVSQIVLKSNSTVRLTTTKQYDLLNRLQQISAAPGAVGAAPVTFGYAYNDTNPKTSALGN